LTRKRPAGHNSSGALVGREKPAWRGQGCCRAVLTQCVTRVNREENDHCSDNRCCSLAAHGHRDLPHRGITNIRKSTQVTYKKWGSISRVIYQSQTWVWGVRSSGNLDVGKKKMSEVDTLGARQSEIKAGTKNPSQEGSVLRVFGVDLYKRAQLGGVELPSA